MKIKLYILACWLLSGLVSCNDWPVSYTHLTLPTTSQV